MKGVSMGRGTEGTRWLAAWASVVVLLAGAPDVTAGARGVQPPNPPVIWLHYDYMVGADGHSHEPHPESIRMVVEAFRRRGITLHIDPHHTAIPESEFLAFGTPTCPGAVNFYELKARYFRPRGPQPWHYVIFGHGADLGGGCPDHFSGYAEIPGYNFIVTLGPFLEFIPPDLLPFVEGGVFMHELGHNLGLDHGGLSGENFKPNYISVMNYIYSFGIRFAATPGSVKVAGRRLDFSDRTLPTLDEAHLDERVGVQAGTTDIVSYLCLPPGHAEPDFVEGMGPGHGPIDWNCNGAIEPKVAHDIDVTGPGYPVYQVLHGHDDWAHIHQWLRTPAYVRGTLRPERITD